MVDLGTLAPPNGSSSGNSINATGQVAGLSDSSGGQRAFRYSDGVGLVNLGVLPGQTESAGRGINDVGVVVGNSGSRIFRYTDAGGMADLGLPSGAMSGIAFAINNAGQIAVTAATPSGTTPRAYRYADATGFLDLGTLGGARSQALAINHAGSVVGFSDSASGASRAFRYTDGGGMIDLGTLPGGTGGAAYAIDALGVIVGIADSAAGSQRAFIYRDGIGLTDLNSLIGTGTGWALRQATGINSHGQIVGVGTRAGSDRAFLLTPVPEPGALVLAAATALAGFVLRHRQGFALTGSRASASVGQAQTAVVSHLQQ
jgi:probable HAF family extracellular repeat protein